MAAVAFPVPVNMADAVTPLPTPLYE